MNDNEIKDAVIHNAKNNECPHCKFLYDTFLEYDTFREYPDQYTGDRDYYLMTEVFVYLYGGDVCNYATGNKIEPLKVEPIEGIQGTCMPFKATQD